VQENPLFSREERATRPVSMKPVDEETIENGGGGERGRKGGWKNMGRVVRPRTSTHYTGNVTNGEIGAKATKQARGERQKDR